MSAPRSVTRALLRVSLQGATSAPRAPPFTSCTRQLHQAARPQTLLQGHVRRIARSPIAPVQFLRQRRLQSTTSAASPLTNRSDEPHSKNPSRSDVPSYEMTFTCKRCAHRSSHRISKQGYHSGTVLISCPGCKNRHLISDHLKIFSDKPVTLEDILSERGVELKKGTVSAEGDVELWEDGTIKEREAVDLGVVKKKGAQSVADGTQETGAA